MSLRARLALVLAGVLVGPLVAAWLTVGVLVPNSNADAARRSADQVARALSAAMRSHCLETGDAAQVVANQVAAASVATGKVSPGDARAAVGAAAARHPGVAVVVLGPTGVVLASSGVEAGQAGTLAQAAAKDSCSVPRVSPGRTWLAERVPVTLDTRGVASVVAWYPLDGASLAALSRDVGLVAGERAALLSSTQPPTVISSTSAPTPAAALSAASGTVGPWTAKGWAYSIAHTAPGAPFDSLGAVPIKSQGLLLRMGLVVLAAVAVAMVLVLLIASRLTRPLDQLARTADGLRDDLSARSGISGSDEVGRLAASFDTMAEELQKKVAELTESRDLLRETFARFGEALGRTHDLDGLLATVLEAAMRGSDAVVGTAMLAEGGELTERASNVDNAPAALSAALDGLRALAAKAHLRREAVTVDRVAHAGPAMAVPLMCEERVVGVLALAREEHAESFDSAAASTVRALAAQAGTAVDNVRRHEESEHLSVTDPLTGAGNVRHLTSRLAWEVDRASRFGRPLSVLMLDLDNFKNVNDTQGHAFGDLVLRDFAERVRGCVRGDVDTVARYGGEEFVIVLPETDAHGASRVAARVVDVVRTEAFSGSGRSLGVTVSVGVAAFPDHGRTVADLMKAADAALYAAKRAGRDRWSVAGASGGAPVVAR